MAVHTSGQPAARRVASFFFNDTATTEIYTLSLHDALPISSGATPATYTSPVTFSELPATVITAPPYEWPTRTTGPSISSMTDAVREASYGSPRSGFGGARTV